MSVPIFYQKKAAAGYIPVVHRHEKQKHKSKNKNEVSR